ncbi:choline dehydrogenase [Actinoplanes sp. NBRC 14428]|nr:choline dehydrogenase [Actinoplanes sp. NBRC 14428]
MTDRAMAYDVVVVGAGAAGCALAHKLTEDPSIEVLLIEAGPADRPDVVTVPARWPETIGSTYDYGYGTVPQSRAAGRTLGVPRGRIVGGSTSVNAMIFSRPWAEDHRTWGRNWTPDEVTAALRDLESHPGGDGSRGHDGPVFNATAASRNELCEAFVAASGEAGYARVEDLNAPGAQGAGWFDLTIRDGRRADAAETFLRPLRDRANLTVRSDTTVARIVVEGGRATALELRAGEAGEVVAISGELVLSAGAIDSPALLLRSGIGPREELLAAGITPVLDLPGVGRNLQDHPSFPVVWSSRRPVAGPANQFAESGLYLRGDRWAGGRTISVAFHHLALTPPGAPAVTHGATALIGLYEPRSRGRLTLDPADPWGPPLIDPRYFDDEGDLAALAAAVPLVREIAAQPALAGFGLVELGPGEAVREPATIEAAIRTGSLSYAHHCGTCAMGPGGVVDQELRVTGVANLRVADASVMPRIPQVAPSATIQMVGWRAAELLRDTLRPTARPSLPVTTTSS